MKFILKKAIEISEADLKTHAVWASFYEPEEFELLEQLGFKLDEVRSALEAVSYSDEYMFPLPLEAVQQPFKFLYITAKVTTFGGKELIGYRSRVSLSVLYKNKVYHFNKGLRSLSEEQGLELSSALKESKLFPLSVELAATGKTEQFSL